MLTIRLQRTGKKNQADFRIALAEKTAPVTKKVVEILGSYNPRKKTFQVKEDRLKYWLSQRVELSETMHNLLVTQGLLDTKKVKAYNIPKKPISAPDSAKAAPNQEVLEGKPVEAVKEEKPAADAATPTVQEPSTPAEVPAAESSPFTETPA